MPWKQRYCGTCRTRIPTGTHCGQHQRPNANTRGYDTNHQRTRAQWAPLVQTGQVDCWRCGQPIEPGTAWDLGHRISTEYGGPEHARCNRSAAGRASHA